MEIVLIGLNHRTATVELRERVAFSVEQACEAADQLRSRGILDETLDFPPATGANFTASPASWPRIAPARWSCSSHRFTNWRRLT